MIKKTARIVHSTKGLGKHSYFLIHKDMCGNVWQIPLMTRYPYNYLYGILYLQEQSL